VSGEVKSAVLRIKSSGNFDGIIRARGIEVEDGAVVSAKFRKSRK
jgi:cytoskeletal protein CcmA (bactofilin family)